MGVQGIDTQTQLSRPLLLSCRICLVYTRACKLNPTQHDCCRIISDCLKPTNLDSVHLLAGIAPPHIRRTVACRMERTHKQFHHRPAASRFKLRKSFMRTVTQLDSSASSSRLTDEPASIKMGLEVAESLPSGSGEDWLLTDCAQGWAMRKQ